MNRAPLHVLVNAINDNAVPRGPDRYLLELLPRLCATDPGLRFTLAHAPWQAAFADAEFGPQVRKLPLAAPRKPAARLEADIGVIYKSDGLEAAFAWIRERLEPLFEKQEAKRKRGQH